MEKKQLYRRLLRYMKPYWPLFILTVIGNAMFASADAYSIYLLGPLLNNGFVKDNLEFLKLLPLIVLGIFVVRGVGSFLAVYFMGSISRRIVRAFRAQLFDRLLILPAKFYDQNTSGQLMSKVIYNVDQVTQATGDSMTIALRQGFLTIGLLFDMFWANWRCTLAILVVIPFILVVVVFAGRRFRKLGKRIQNGMGIITHTTEETILGYREIRIFGGQQYQKTLFDKLLTYNFTQEMKSVFTDAINTPIVQFICAIAIAAVLYFVFRNGNHLFTAGTFVSFMGAMLAVLKPIRDLTKVNASIQRGLAASEGLFDLIDAEPESNQGKRVLSKIIGDIRFEKVSFAYASDKPGVLRSVSLEIPAGKTVALVGRSGSGKSTLVSLLCRFYEPTQGKITLDGVNIQDLTLESLRQHISVVSQQVHLFNDTLFHNIAYGGDDAATEAQVIEAAKAAHAWEFIQKLPEGLNTLVGENGFNLSGGQRQRIAIARAILKNAPILILDEATSALDNESERAVQEALEGLMKNRTTLVIAHRLSTIEKADQIIVMDQGAVVETGTHHSLLAKDGMYAQLQRSAEV